MKRRRGFTLLELSVAAVMLAVLLSMSVQMLRVLSAHQRAAERRAFALQATQAVAEQAGNLPWDQLTTEAASRIKIPPQLDPYLPGAKLTAAVEEEPAPDASKRIMIDLIWNGPNGLAVAPVHLTSWAFRE